MDALDVLSRGDPQQLQEPMLAALAELRKWMVTATPPAPAATTMDTDGDEVQRKRKDTIDGPLSKFDFDGETEKGKTHGGGENEAGVTALGTSKQ